jgi:hypothetical protein
MQFYNKNVNLVNFFIVAEHNSIPKYTNESVCKYINHVTGLHKNNNSWNRLRKYIAHERDWKNKTHERDWENENSWKQIEKIKLLKTDWENKTHETDWENKKSWKQIEKIKTPENRLRKQNSWNRLRK